VVRIANGSDQPLAFSERDVRLRDADGVPYRYGTTTGGEAKLRGQNLDVGGQAQGWVWFAIPEGAAVAAVEFVGPPPVLRIRLA
jgi:hypothetical protein